MRNPKTLRGVMRLVGASALSLGLGGVCLAIAAGNALPASATSGPNIGVTVPSLPTVTFSSAGQVVPLAFVVTNTGDSEGTGVSVSLFDPVSGTTSPAKCLTNTLAAGAHMTCSVSYTVSKADLGGADPIRLYVRVSSGGSSSGGITLSGPTLTTPFTIPVVDGPDVVVTPTTTTAPANATTPARTAETPITTSTAPGDTAASPTAKDAPLAFTGFDVLPLLVTGGALVLVGAAIVALSQVRRRRHLGQLDQ